MMYLKLNADYKQGELVPLLDDAIYVYCDVCKSLHRVQKNLLSGLIFTVL